MPVQTYDTTTATKYPAVEFEMRLVVGDQTPLDEERLLKFVQQRIPNFKGKVGVQVLETGIPYNKTTGVFSVTYHMLDITYGIVFMDNLEWHVTQPNVLGHQEIQLNDNHAVLEHSFMTYELLNDDGTSVKKWTAGEDAILYVTQRGFDKIKNYIGDIQV